MDLAWKALRMWDRTVRYGLIKAFTRRQIECYLICAGANDKVSSVQLFFSAMPRPKPDFDFKL